jgi:hypothetical protein
MAGSAISFTIFACASSSLGRDANSAIAEPSRSRPSLGLESTTPFKAENGATPWAVLGNSRQVCFQGIDYRRTVRNGFFHHHGGG